ncbi:hypothetical protein NST62_12795 [Ureibacillus sp. FSL K6-8385]|uniref:hypothetical protein n=1 Tax=Ureibacillus sp. FSL K6-8385 TaxID=2954684 RepID=UPI0031583335
MVEIFSIIMEYWRDDAMDQKEIQKMRMKQLAVMNFLVLAALAVYYICSSVFTIRTSLFYLAFGIYFVIFAVIRLIKTDSTKSMIPLLEKVAKYEKEKLGDEWYRRRKFEAVLYVILGVLFLFLSFGSGKSAENFFSKPDTLFFIMYTLFFLLMVNILTVLNNQKMDHSTEAELKGFARKWLLVGAAAALAFAIIIFQLILFYVFSQIN